MAVNVNDVIAGLDPARRRKVEERAAELIAEEMTLRELRKARQLTQVSVARQLLARTASRGWSSAVICCSRRCAGQSRPWAEASRSSPRSPIARRLSCSASPSGSPAIEGRTRSERWIGLRKPRHRNGATVQLDTGRGVDYRRLPC